MLKHIALQIDPHLANINGKVFYSGRSAFAVQGGIYVLGLNPGGDPKTHPDETISSHTKFIMSRAPADWSAYVDEIWQGKGPTTQKRICHLLSSLGADVRRVASSNLIFNRSKRIASLQVNLRQQIEICWPVHLAVIQSLKPRAIICFGQACAEEVRKRVDADRHVASFSENNERRWTSCAWRSSKGTTVFQLAHPSIADWTKVATDPSPMVKAALPPEVLALYR